MAKKNKGAFEVDFTNVTEGGGGNKRIKAGTYPAILKSYEVTEARSSGNTMFVLTWELTGGKHKGWTGKDRIVLTEKALFRAFNLLKAMGKNPAKARAQLNPADWVGEELNLDIEDEEYTNNSGDTVLTSGVGGYSPLGGAAPDDEDEAPKKKKKKSKDDTVDKVDLEDEL